MTTFTSAAYAQRRLTRVKGSGALRPPRPSSTSGLFCRLRADDGFSLVEAIVALAIATGVLLALGAALGNGVKATLTGRQNQTASDIATERLETVRQMTFASAQLATTDLGSDSRITAGKFDPGTGTPEAVYAGPTGSINPHTQTVNRNGGKFQVRTYVTIPGDTTTVGASDYYHRLTVVVTWETSGVPHTRRASTFLVNTARGLPLPRFTFVPVGTLGADNSRSQDVGATPYWGFKVTNLGARDAWNIAASSGSWTYYVDTNGDGVHDATETTTLGDFDLNGTPDTGQLEPTTRLSIVAVRSVTLSASEQSTCTTTTSCPVTFTATSAAQPAATTASKSQTFHQVVANGASPSPTPSATASASPTASPTGAPVVTASPNPPPTATSNGGTVRFYYLHNVVPNSGMSTTASTTLTNMLADQNTPTNTAFYDYSTEAGGGASGRRVLPGGTQTTTTASQVADWRYQAPSKMEFDGVATVTVYVSCTTTGPVTFSASIGDSSSASSNYGGGAIGNATMSTCSTTGFTPLTIGVPVNFSITNNRWLTVRVYVSSATAPTVRLLYDVTPDYNAVVSMPQVKP